VYIRLDGGAAFDPEKRKKTLVEQVNQGRGRESGICQPRGILSSCTGKKDHQRVDEFGISGLLREVQRRGVTKEWVQTGIIDPPGWYLMGTEKGGGLRLTSEDDFSCSGEKRFCARMLEGEESKSAGRPHGGKVIKSFGIPILLKCKESPQGRAVFTGDRKKGRMYKNLR